MSLVIAQSTACVFVFVSDAENGTILLSEDEHTKLLETLDFLKVDAETVEKTPCVWSEIHSLRELMGGLLNVNEKARKVEVAWDSRLGLAVRKNKFA